MGKNDREITVDVCPGSQRCALSRGMHAAHALRADEPLPGAAPPEA